MAQMIVPWEALSSSALRGLVEDFVTREGTEYGHVDVALETKVEEVMAQLRRGEAVIVYDSLAASSSIVPADEVAGGQPDGSF